MSQKKILILVDTTIVMKMDRFVLWASNAHSRLLSPSRCAEVGKDPWWKRSWRTNGHRQTTDTLPIIGLIIRQGDFNQSSERFHDQTLPGAPGSRMYPPISTLSGRFMSSRVYSDKIVVDQYVHCIAKPYYTVESIIIVMLHRSMTNLLANYQSSILDRLGSNSI